MPGTAPSPEEFTAALRHPSQAKVDEMRRIGQQPGACGLDAKGRLVVVQWDGSRKILKS